MVQLNDRVVLAVYNWARYAPTSVHSSVNRTAASCKGRCGGFRSSTTSRSGTRRTLRPTGLRRRRNDVAALLARCYDALHNRPAPINVISSTASRHDPAAFVFALGDAYRASGRTRRSSTHSDTTRTRRIRGAAVGTARGPI